MTKATNKHRRDVEFHVEDSVFLKIQPHRQAFLKPTIHAKLAAHYYGPFQLIQKVGKVAYRLKLLEEARIRPVFHLSQLKKAVGQHLITSTLLKGLEVKEK